MMTTVKKPLLNWDEAAGALKKGFAGQIETDRPLSSFNTFGTGGPARLFAEVRTTEELAKLVQVAHELYIPYFMLGGGSNVLVSDRGYEGLIIKNSIMGLSTEGESITSGAGERLEDLINFAAQCALSGLEFATGIWGTVGGAVYGNAGAYGADISTLFESAQLVDRYGNMREEKMPYFDFSYRYSNLKKTGEFVAKAKFALRKGKKESIQAKIDEISALRSERLPRNEKSAGCFFKNIIDSQAEHGKLPAGKLLEGVGAKDLHFGGASIFGKHANIIINTGTATSEDIRKLASILKDRVKEKFGIELKEEITYLGQFEEEGL